MIYRHSSSSRAFSLSRFKLSPLSSALQPLLWAGLALGAGAVQAQNAADTSSTTLKEITVRDSSDVGGLPKANPGGKTASGGSLGILGNVSTMDSPFSSTNFTSDLIQDQQARTLADVVENDPSVRVLTGPGGFGDDFLIRGFPVGSGDTSINGLYGLTSASRVSTELVERVEVLKGPGALVNGIAPSGSVGGGVNVVTKRAADTPLTRLTTTFRTDGQIGTHLDLGRRFGTDNQWGIRVNGSLRDGRANIKEQKQTVGVGSIGLDYLGQRLRWSFDAFLQQEDMVGGTRPQLTFAATTAILPGALPGDANIYPGGYLNLKDKTTLTRIEFDINDQLTAFAAYGVRDGAAQQLLGVARNTNTAGAFSLQSSTYDSYSKTSSGNAGLRAKFRTGPVGHTLVASVSSLEQETGIASSAVLTRASNIYNPVPVQNPGRGPGPVRNSETNLNSLALADTLAMFDDRVLLTLGLRQQTVKVLTTTNYDKTAVSPLVGLVVKPTSNVSVYGNFSGGLTRGNTAPTGTANAGEVFPPYKSEQYEAGVKAEFAGMTGTASVYQIARPNAFTDPVTNIYSMDGEQRNRGLEFSASGEPVRGLRLMGGIALTKAKITRAVPTAVSFNKKPVGVPEHTLNFGGEWDASFLPGLTLNGRAVYTSSVYFSADNLRQLPGWTRFDIGARYKTVIAGKNTVFRANIENVTNKNAWVLSGSFVSPMAPRTLVVSAAVDF